MIKISSTLLFIFLILSIKTEATLQLYDPEEAPQEIREKVMRGFKILELTSEALPNNVGDKVSCSNCHFNGGNSLGGKNNGISLVGVSFAYPRYNQRAKKSISLRQRVNFCFERSMNGTALPEESAEMDAIIAYLTWISQGAKDSKEYPWLGMKVLKVQHAPDGSAGQVLYERKCAGCHQSNGQGWFAKGMWVPPIAGNKAFNDGAGMASPSTFASFIYWNMPLGQPSLTEEQALDIAEYVLSLPRPHYTMSAK